MQHFKIAIDESGGIEPVINYKTLRPHVNPFQTHSYVGAAILNAEIEEEFNFLWNGLRQEIGNQLEIDYLPSIHMRLMWGKDRPRKHSGLPNPFLIPTNEQIFDWVNKALIISHKFSFDKQALRFRFMIQDRKQAGKRFLHYYSHPVFEKEVKFLKALHGPAYRRYHAIATSPVVDSLGRILFETNYYLGLNRAKGDFLIDNNPDVAGYNLLSVLQVFKENGKLSNIVNVQTLQDMSLSYEDIPLVQLIDLQTYLYNKHFTSNGKDEIVANLLTRYPHPHHKQGNKIINYEKFQKANELMVRKDLILIRYEIARREAIQIAPFLEDYFIDIEEFKKRASKLQKTSAGVSVLKEKWLEKLKNG